MESFKFHNGAELFFIIDLSTVPAPTNYEPNNSAFALLHQLELHLPMISS